MKVLTSGLLVILLLILESNAQPALTPAQRKAEEQAYITKTIQADGKDKCLKCVAPGRNDYFCPSTGICYRNQTEPNPYNFEIPCPNAIHMNQTD
jgi:hypothetical protein